MAFSVYTCSVFKGYPAKNNPVGGDVSVSGGVMFGATTSANDQVYLAKIPNGAVIVDIIEDHTSGATTQVLQFGLDRGVAAGGAGNLSCLISGGAQATVNRRNVLNANGGPWGTQLTVSLSDLDPVRYAILIGSVVSGTTTTSVFVNFTIIYRTDGPAGTPPNATAF